MKKNEKIQKVISLFLACVMFFGMLFENSSLFAQGTGVDRVETKITKFEIKNQDGSAVPPNQEYGYWNQYRLEMDWDASVYGNQLKKDDYFIVKLPKQFKFPTEGPTVDFPLYAPDNQTVIANAHVDSNGEAGGGTVTVTFTDYVENKDNIKGNMYLQAGFAHNNIIAGGSNTIIIEIGGVQTSVNINIGVKPTVNNETFTKWGQKVPGNNEQATWVLRINHKKGNFKNLTISDRLFVNSGNLPPEIHYILNSFVLKEVEFDVYGNVTKVINTYEYNALKEFLHFSDNDTKFTFSFSEKFGDTNGRQYIMEYKSTYIPQLLLRNEAIFQSIEENVIKQSSFKNAQAGGGGQGDLTQKIKIFKVDEDNMEIKLPNAEFLITKVKDNSTFILKTDGQGEAVSEKLEEGKYKIKEIKAPEGYILDETEQEVTVVAGEPLFWTAKNTKNITVKARKVWEDNGYGGDKKDLYFCLKADDKLLNDTKKKVEGTEDITWKVPKYNEQGKEIKYEVIEIDSEGKPWTENTNWESKIEGTHVGGFTVTNTYKNNNIKVEGKKTWEDNNDQDGKRPTEIKINLMKKVGNAEAVKVDTKTVTAGPNGEWKWSWNNLPKYENGQEIAYIITEEKVEGYSTEVDGYNVKNLYTPEKTSIRVTKAWEDNNDQDGKRPNSVTIKLLADEQEVPGKTLTLTKINNWTGSFTDLDEYKAGKKIKYTVKEETVGSGYTSAITGTAENGFTVTNTREIDKISVEGSKTWEDNNDQDGKRPTEIKINLMKKVGNAEAVKVDTKTVTAGPNGEWKWSWNNLPKYENGQEIAYIITEEKVEGYSTEVDGYNVKNLYTPEKTSIRVTKAWEDNNDQDGKRPNSVIIKLLADEQEVPGKTLILTNANNWTGSFTDLDKYKAGKKIEYTVKEEAVGNGYTSAITGTAENGFTVTNTRESEKMAVEGSKTWNDKDNQDGKRPTEITINLLKNGTVFKTKTVREADGWKWKFEDLDKYENGQEITYTITEEQVEGYSAEVNGYNVKNSYTPGKVSVQVTKAWEDNNDQDGKRPNSVIIKLLADEQEVPGKMLILTKVNNWTGSFTDLDEYKAGKKIEYTVKEEAVGNEYTSAITGTAQNGFTVTNTRELEKTVVEGSKTWDDKDNQDGKRPETITINLLKNGVKVDSKIVNEANGWKWKFEDLDKYENGQEITYTITEEQVQGYSTEVNGYNVKNSYTPGKVSVQITKAWEDKNNQDGKRPNSVTIKLLADGQEVPGKTLILTKVNNWTGSFTDLDEYKAGKKIEYTVKEEAVGNEYTSAITGTAQNGFTVTNTRELEKTVVEGSKTWDDKDNQDGKRPETITINLLKNGVKVDSKIVNEADGWKWKFEDLDKYENGQEVSYTITEEKVEEYSTEVSLYNVKNSYTPGKTSVQVIKAWEDKNNQDGKRPESVKIKLLADGKEVSGKILTLAKANNWTGSFTDLDEYKAGKKIEYTVKEELVGNGYTSVITGTARDGYIVTNTREPEKTVVEGEKIWDDKDNQDGKRPKEITINLLKNGTKINTKTVTKSDSWKWKFEGLDKYENGQEITYTITEEKVEGYSTEVNRYNVKNSYTPGKTSVQVTKVWADNNDQDRKRPESITIKLLADGKEVSGKTLTLAKANNWTGTFTDLDEFKDGKKIEYTVKEEPIGNGYTSVITGTAKDGYIVTNTRKPIVLPSTPEGTIKVLPRTGDGADLSMYAWMMFASGILLVLIEYKRRKKAN